MSYVMIPVTLPNTVIVQHPNPPSNPPPGSVPVVLTDFSDPNYFVPAGDAAQDTLQWIAGALKVKASGARDNNMMHMAGVLLRGRLYPSKAGVLQFQVTIGSLTMSADAAAGDLSAVGVSFINCINAQNEWHMVGIGAINADNRAITKSSTGNPMSSGWNMTQSVSLGATPTTLAFKFTVLRDETAAANPHRYFMGQFTGGNWDFCTYSIDGGAFTRLITGATGWPVGFVTGSGIRPFFGLTGKTRNQNLTGTFTEFRMIDGILRLE